MTRIRPHPYAERLAALRARLAAAGLDGFVVPRADEHQGEYVPASAERLAWLSGFTGSAGMAVVLAERAALFVDGRYTVQAGIETDPALFEVRHLIAPPPADWIAEAMPRGGRLGFDPWLHTPNQRARLTAGCERAGASLAACPDNPLDQVWTDRPAPPAEPIVPYPPAYAGRDCAQKRAEVAALLRAEGLDAAILVDPASAAWLFNLRGADVPFAPLPLVFALVRSDGTAALFADPGRIKTDLSVHFGEGVKVLPRAALDGAIGEMSGRRVRIDPEGCPIAIADRLTAADATLRPGDDPCALPRARKNDVELAGMRAAHVRDGAALCRFLAWLSRQGAAGTVTEISAARRLEGFRADGALFMGPSFPTISAFGSHGAIVHYRADDDSDRALAPGGIYLLDSGGQYLDGTTDVTRTVLIGDGAEEELGQIRDRFTRVLKGHIALASARFPAGTTGSQLDALARRFLWDAGLDYDHGTGHGVGCYLSVHEGPQRISKQPNRVALAPGMVLSIEPGFYREGAYGIRIENLATVVPASDRGMLAFEPLTLAPIDRRLIAAHMLERTERDWLDAYHARVRAEVGPELARLGDDEARRWLEAETAPI